MASRDTTQAFPDDDDLLDAEMEALLNDDVPEPKDPSLSPTILPQLQPTPQPQPPQPEVDYEREKKEEETFSGDDDDDIEDDDDDDSDGDDDGMLETSLSLKDVSQIWETFSLSTKRATWDSQVLSLKLSSPLLRKC